MTLRVIKTPGKELNFLVYDLEWEPSVMRLRLVGCYDGETHYGYQSGNMIAAFLDEQLTVANAGRIFFAHAGGLADIQFIMDEVIRCRPTWKVEGSVSGSALIICRIEDEEGHTWIFADSFWLLRDSLDNIGKSIGLHKGGSDYYCSCFPHCGHKIRRGSCVCTFAPDDEPCPRGRHCRRKPSCIFWAPMSILKPYNERDNEVLYEALKRFEQEILALGGEMKMTIASTAMRLFRGAFLTGDLVTRERVNTTARLAYVASRVEVIGARCGAANYFDINSSFPRSMCEPQPAELKKTLKTWDGSRLALVRAKVTVPEMFLPPLPVRFRRTKSSVPRVFFPTGTWTAWFAGTDLELLEEAGGIIERVYQALTFFETNDLRAYVELLYGRRKVEKDPFRRLVYKYLLNSLPSPLACPVCKGRTGEGLKETIRQVFGRLCERVFTGSTERGA